MSSCWRSVAAGGVPATRLSAEGREVFQRMTTGDLVDELQDALDADLAADPLLGGHDDGD